jgi:hypothetical protein
VSPCRARQPASDTAQHSTARHGTATDTVSVCRAELVEVVLSATSLHQLGLCVYMYAAVAERWSTQHCCTCVWTTRPCDGLAPHAPPQATSTDGGRGRAWCAPRQMKQLPAPAPFDEAHSLASSAGQRSALQFTGRCSGGTPHEAGGHLHRASQTSRSLHPCLGRARWGRNQHMRNKRASGMYMRTRASSHQNEGSLGLGGVTSPLNCAVHRDLTMLRLGRAYEWYPLLHLAVQSSRHVDPQSNIPHDSLMQASLHRRTLTNHAFRPWRHCGSAGVTHVAL